MKLYLFGVIVDLWPKGFPLNNFNETNVVWSIEIYPEAKRERCVSCYWTLPAKQDRTALGFFPFKFLITKLSLLINIYIQRLKIMIPKYCSNI